jgi:T4-like virus tail tube protein gp19
MAATDRTYVSGRFALDLQGGFAGFLKSVDGGAVKAPVISEPAGLDNIVHKHLGSPEYDAISIQLGLSSSPAINDWIQASWDKKYMRKSGAVIACDFDYKAKSAREFQEALISEVGLPALDGAAKDPAYMTVKFECETIRFAKRGGEVVKGTFTEHQKTWLPSNFTFTLGDLNTKAVSKIDAITVKQTIAKHEIGEARDRQIEPAKLEFPNVTIYVAESHAESWITWADDFIIKGNNGQGAEKTGAIVFKSPNMKDDLGTLDLKGVGITSITPDKREANAEAIAKVKIELYVEQMVLKFNAGKTLKVGG